MPGLVPGIHVLAASTQETWMAGTSPAMTARAVNLFFRFIAKARPAPNSQRRSPHLTIDKYRVRCLSSRFAFQPLTLFETRFFEL
jgi:hypothetical protein